MTDKLRAAAEAALDAMNRLHGTVTGPDLAIDLTSQITALEDALAEAELSNEGRVARWMPKTECDCDMRTRLVGDGCAVCNPTLAAELAEPQQEPVSWGMPSIDGSIVDCIHPEEHARKEGKYTVPLYTTPPRREWQGLTEEEIYPLYSEPSSDVEMLEFARAVEQKLKEKNHDVRCSE